MVAANFHSTLERFISDLTDAAVEVVLRAKPRWNSIDVELALGRQIESRVRSEYRYQRWVGGAARSGFKDNFIGRLVEVAYQLGLEAGANRSFVELELEIWNAFRRVSERAGILCSMLHSRSLAAVRNQAGVIASAS